MSRPTGRTTGPRRHLDLARILDFLEDRLTPTAAREVEEHLAAPCPTCREQVRLTGLLVERMRGDRVPEVPPAVHQRALEVFVPQPVRSRSGRLAARIAALVFDSLSQPLPAAARRAVGEARRLRFELGAGTLELELEPEGSRAFALRGQLVLEEPALHRIELTNGGEHHVVWPDGTGRFALEGLAAGRLVIAVTGPTGRFRIPPVTL